MHQSRPVTRVAVLGLGLIGGSLLQAVRRNGVETIGFDVDPQSAAAARAAGYLVAPTDEAAVHDADVVVLAMPLPELPAALRSVAPHLGAETTITDVGTLKRPVLEAVRKIVPQAEFVGGHPLAGVEDTGWTAADPDLFRDCPWALTLDSGTSLDAWLRLASLVCDLGARPVPTTAADQDVAVARVIGLPHVLAEALALTGLAGGPLGLTLAAGSYRSGSRVARTRPELVTSWCDGNAALPAALDDAIAHLTSAREALAARRSILPLAAAGHDARINWEHRRVEPVEVAVAADALVAHGRAGGWITTVLREPDGVRVLGMRPDRARAAVCALTAPRRSTRHPEPSFHRRLWSPPARPLC